LGESRSISTTCKICGKAMRVFKYRLDMGEGKYCGRSCASKGLYLEHPEHRERVSQACRVAAKLRAATPVEAPCKFCGKLFYPMPWKLRVRGDRVFCSRSCAQKDLWATRPDIREGASARMRKMSAGKEPWNKGKAWSAEVKEKLRASWTGDGSRKENFKKIRGGNGSVSATEALVRKILTRRFLWNFAIATGSPRGEGYPTCYKLDFADPEKKLVVEVDGASHNSIERKDADAKKTAWLSERGWKVLRVSNAQVLSMCGISKLTELPTSLPTERSFITALK